MADNSKKVSELPTAANVASTDRVLVLRSPSSNASVRTVNVSTLFTSSSNLSITSGSNTWTFNTTGSLKFPDNTSQNTAYAPVIASFNPNFSTNTGNTLSFGTQTGSYTKINGLCFFRASVEFGNSTYADGGGQYQFTLPFPVLATTTIRGGTLHNTNTASIYHIAGIADIAANTTTMLLYYSGGTTDLAWKNTTPVSWFTGNTTHFDISGIYQVT
jgi:hypothetical protein